MSVLIVSIGLPMATGVWAQDEKAEKTLAGIMQIPDDQGDVRVLEINNGEIKDVLRLLADEFDLNIVVSDDVVGKVTLRLKETTLRSMLDAILLPKAYDYLMQGNVIQVGPAKSIEESRKRLLDKEEQEPLQTEVFVLGYLDAEDVQKVVSQMLSIRGSSSVLKRQVYQGFEFISEGLSGQASSSSGGSSQSGTGSTTSGSASGSSSASGAGKSALSNTLLVIDVESRLEEIAKVIKEIDISPRQIMIDAQILEVSTNSLEDLGLDVADDSSVALRNKQKFSLNTDVNSGASNTSINSGIFGNVFPASTDAGINTVFQNLAGREFAVIIHALLQDRRTRTLSSPSILTLENHPAAILVGERFPIFQSSVSDQGTATESVASYQAVGVSLQVVAQVTSNRDIIMIIHPTISSLGAFVTGSTGLSQPRINIREADTRVLIKNGETLVIGGLLEDVEDDIYFRVPVIGSIPFLGNLFTRRQDDLDQRNLLIFLTPRIIDAAKARMSNYDKEMFESIGPPRQYDFMTQKRQKERKARRGGHAEQKAAEPQKSYEKALDSLEKDASVSDVEKLLNELDTGLEKESQTIDAILEEKKPT